MYKILGHEDEIDTKYVTLGYGPNNTILICVTDSFGNLIEAIGRIKDGVVQAGDSVNNFRLVDFGDGGTLLAYEKDDFSCSVAYLSKHGLYRPTDMVDVPFELDCHGRIELDFEGPLNRDD